MTTINKKAVLRRLQVPQKDEELAVWETSRWLNRDNVPLPPGRRTWGPWSFVGYWLTVGMTMLGWTTGSTLLALGLTVGQAMAAVVIGQCFIALAVVLTGLVGAKWHVGFPMWNRMTWGMRASYFPLINRIILSFTWTATQAWYGGSVLKTMLGAMFPSIYRMKNVFPESSHLTSADFLCFVLFLLITCPLLLVPPEHFRKPFIFVSISSTVTCLSLFIWALSKGHGAGPLVRSDSAAIIGVKQAKGADLAWAMFYGISSQMGSWCAGILNMSDYTRFAAKPRDQIWSQLFIVPIFGTFSCIIGIICTSVARELYPDKGLLWQPYALFTAIQEEGGAGARAAVFFASAAFVLSQLGVNIACNAISGGIDLASCFPRYINIRRGAFITTAMALPMCPWALTSGATVFISVMGGYATFLAPMTGVMISDYVLIRKQKMKLSSLYVCDSSSIYFYWKGLNWRAPAAWALGVVPLFPGFISTVSTVSVPIGLTHVYYLCWPLGFTISLLTYWALATVFPLDHIGEVDERDTFGTFGDPEFADSDVGAEKATDLERPMSKEIGVVGIQTIS